MYKDGSRTKIIRHLYYMYSNEAERANEDIYDNFILKKRFSMIYLELLQRCRGYMLMTSPRLVHIMYVDVSNTVETQTLHEGSVTLHEGPITHKSPINHYV